MKARPYNEGWIATYPELATRPLLLEEMGKNRSLQHFVWKLLNVYGAIGAGIADPNLRPFVLSIAYDHFRRRVDQWQGTLEAEDKRIFNELVGLHRNFYHNVAGLRLRAEHDVELLRSRTEATA